MFIVRSVKVMQRYGMHLQVDVVLFFFFQPDSQGQQAYALIQTCDLAK